MNGTDAVGLVGELLSFVGLACGLPLLLFGSLRRAMDGTPDPTEIVVVQGQRAPLARWFAAGDFHERALRPWEREHVGINAARTAFVSSRDPSRMRLGPRSALTSSCLAPGTVLVSVGIIGFAASIIPMVLQ